MKTIKVSEATNTQLNWLVAKCEGHTQETTVFPNGVRSPRVFIADGGVAFDALTGAYLDFTTDWSQMGPIIEREDIDITSVGVKNYRGRIEGGNPVSGYGPSRIIAAARCYVTGRLGEIVEVPGELT